MKKLCHGSWGDKFISAVWSWRFVVDRVAVGQVYLRTLRFSLVSIIPANIHTRLHLLLLSERQEGVGYQSSKQKRTEKWLQISACFKQLNYPFIIVFCVITPCSLVGKFRCFGRLETHLPLDKWNLPPSMMYSQNSSDDHSMIHPQNICQTTIIWSNHKTCHTTTEWSSIKPVSDDQSRMHPQNLCQRPHRIIHPQSLCHTYSEPIPTMNVEIAQSIQLPVRSGRPRDRPVIIPGSTKRRFLSTQSVQTCRIVHSTSILMRSNCNAMGLWKVTIHFYLLSRLRTQRASYLLLICFYGLRRDSCALQRRLSPEHTQ